MRRFDHLVAPLLLLAAGVAVYSNSLPGPFIFDDIRSIRENPQIRQLTFSAPPQTTVSGRPLLALSLSINYAISGLEPWSYHLFNLAVHILAAVTLFAILRRSELAGEIAFATALIWMLHPLQTSSVTYIIQRAESLMGLFYLLTLYCVIRGWHAGAIAACAAGMATKETMITAPVMVLLYDRIFLPGPVRQRWRLYAGLAATCVWPVWVMARGVHTESVGFGLENLSVWDYALTQCGVILHYLRLAIWPHPLVLDYYWQVSKSAGAVAAILLLIVATVWLLVRKPRLGFLGAWFFVILAPTSSVVPVATEIAAEHRMYLPVAAVAALLALACYRVRRELVFGVAMVFGILTVQRNADYRSEIAIWEDTVAKRPDNPRARNNLGGALKDAGRFQEALAQFEAALRLEPNFPRARLNFGIALAELGRLDEAVAQFEELLRQNPDAAAVQYNLGVALARQGKAREALDHFGRAVALDPNDGAARHAFEDLRKRMENR